jgi:hypothetical protein
VRSLALAFAAVLTSGGKHFGQWLSTVCGFACWDFSYVQARQEDARAPAGRYCGPDDRPVPTPDDLMDRPDPRTDPRRCHTWKTPRAGFHRVRADNQNDASGAESEMPALERARARPGRREPGFWLQYDYGDAPVVDVVKTVLFVAWLAFSRLRIVIVFRDKPMPSVLAPSTGRRLMKSPKLARNPPDELTQNPVRRPTTQSLVAAIGLSAVNVCLRTWRQLQARNTVPEGA